MYRYDEFDRQFVLQRTAQFADQVNDCHALLGFYFRFHQLAFLIDK